MISTLSWIKTLTELRLTSFVDDDGGQYADLDVIPQLNRMLRLLKDLVVFELTHTLEDLELFSGMGRIPFHRVKYDCERETEYREREEEEKEKEEGGYVWRRPLLERIHIWFREEYQSTSAACNELREGFLSLRICISLTMIIRGTSVPSKCKRSKISSVPYSPLFPSIWLFVPCLS